MAQLNCSVMIWRTVSLACLRKSITSSARGSRWRKAISSKASEAEADIFAFSALNCPTLTAIQGHIEQTIGERSIKVRRKG